MIKLHESLTIWNPGYAYRSEKKKRSEKECFLNPCIKCLLEKKPSSSTEPLIELAHIACKIHFHSPVDI